MKNRQLNRRQMCARMRSFFEKHASTFEDIAPLKAETDRFAALYDQLDKQAVRQARDLRRLQTEKQRLRREWIDLLIVLSQAARSWAFRHQPDLLSSLPSSPRNLGRMAQEACVAAGKELLLRLREHEAALVPYGITTGMFEEAEQKAEALQNALPAAGRARKMRLKATIDIAETLTLLEETLQVTDALMHGRFSISDPEIVREYRLMRKVGKYVLRHTGLRVTLRSRSGEPVQDVKAIIRELNRSATSNIHGLLEIVGFNTGVYHIDIYLGDKIVKTIIREIPRGRIVEVEEVV